MADESHKSTAELVKRQGELAARLLKLGNEVNKCSNELDRITKELEKRVASDAAADNLEYDEVPAEAQPGNTESAAGEKKAQQKKEAKRDLNYYTNTKTANTELREAAKKERNEKINKPRPAVREFKHW